MAQGGLLYYDMGPGRIAFSTEREADLPFPVIQAHQVHGDRIAVIDRPDLTREELEGYDALITALPDCAIGVRTADCIPILLSDARRGVVAAVHAGWRGTVAGIVRSTLLKMNGWFGCSPSDVQAVIGPGIGPESFQVGEEVVEAFAEASFPMNLIWHEEGPRIAGTMRGGSHIDLWLANRWLMEQAGVPSSSIHTAGICTYQSNDRFYSARREGTHCPRIITAIKMLSASSSG